MPHAMFRPRRLREKGLLRRMVRETTDDLVYSLFAVHGRGTACASRSIGYRASSISLDELVKETKDVASMGVPAVLLFEKGPRGHCGVVEEGTVRNDLSLDLIARGRIARRGGRLGRKGATCRMPVYTVEDHRAPRAAGTPRVVGGRAPRSRPPGPSV
jgi:delta-aminolevulinic acid dehydratase/porphobilinogen synthase